MTDSELKALISLLDDDDPEIQGHVQGKLVSMGGEVIPVLENAWEAEDNELLQEAIEEVIYTIQSEEAIEGLVGWFQQEHPALLDGWIQVTSFQYPELDGEALRKQINRLVSRIWLELRAGMTIQEKILTLNKMIFARERFRANKKNLGEPQNYYLNGLMDSRKGAPVSLGFLYLILCRELEIPLKGLILPRYFVLGYKDEQQEFFIDVFNKGGLFKRTHLEQYLKEVNVEVEEKYFLAASNQRMILSFIQTLIQVYRRRKDDQKVKEYTRLLDSLQKDHS